MGDITPRFNPSIFRTDHPIILACNRYLATIIPALFDYSPQGYSAGQVMAKNTVSGNYGPYTNSGSSGLGTAAGVLLKALDWSEESGTGPVVSTLCVGGQVYYDKLVNVDANAVTNLGGRKVTDATGTNILIF